MTPRRLDRGAIAARVPDTPRWILEVLMDVFEPAALAAMQVGDAKRRKAKGRLERDKEMRDD